MLPFSYLPLIFGDGVKTAAKAAVAQASVTPTCRTFTAPISTELWSGIDWQNA